MSLNKIIIPIFLMIIPIISFGPFLCDLFITLIAIYALSTIIKEKKIKAFLDPTIIIFLLLSFYLLINSIFLSNNVKLSIQVGLFYFRFPLFILGISIIFSKFEFSKIIKINTYILGIVFIFFSLDILHIYYFQNNIFGIPQYDPNRISSIFKDELRLGRYLIILLPIFISFIVLYYKDLKYTLVILFLSLILLCTIILISLTGDRSPFFLFLIFIILFSLQLIFFQRKILILLIFGLSFFLIAINNINKTGDRIYRSFEFPSEKNDFTVISKTYTGHFKTALNIGKNNLFFGSGPKTFREQCGLEENLVKGDNFCSTHPHNFYLQLYSETGLIGLFFLFTYFTYIVFLFLKNIIKNRKYDYEIIAENSTLIGIIVFIFPLSTTNSFYNNWNSVMFFILVAYHLLLKKNNESKF